MAILRFEHRTRPLASRARFASRLISNALFAAPMVFVALLIGILGYRFTEQMDWLDAFLNASMLLGGMGPVSPLHTVAGKWFAGLYALFCGLVVVVTTGIVLAPVLHRVLHALHVECD